MTKQVEFRGLLPYLYYEDAGAMLDWLSDVFGFEERGRYVDKDGIVRQAEMLVGQNELWFSGHGPGFWESKGGRPDTWIGVWVDDVDAMYERVKAKGVASEPPEDKDYDVRSYSVKDPEGVSWGFMKRLGKPYVQRIPTEEGGLEEILSDRSG
jgi:uncharacterized glyoxalase superfamily protein PhnB